MALAARPRSRCSRSRPRRRRPPREQPTGRRPTRTLRRPAPAPGSPLRAGTVAGLRRRWRFRLTELTTFSGVISATPLVVGGGCTSRRCGATSTRSTRRPGSCSGNGSPSAWSEGRTGSVSAGGRLYGATDVAAFALDRATGRVLWRHLVTERRQPVNSAPLVAGGLVVLGTTAPRPGGKGSVVALSAASGAVRWRRSTIAGAWANPRVASGGGVWWTPTPTARAASGRRRQSAAVGRHEGAAERGRLPRSGALHRFAALARPRHGPPALVRPGRRTRRARPGLHLPPVLASIRARELVVGPGKGGRVIAWDRRTHRRVWETAVGLHRNDSGPLPARPVALAPGRPAAR